MTARGLTTLLEKDAQDPQRSDEVQAHPHDPWDEAQGSRLLCARCGHAVTASGWCIQIADAHEHSFVNPHGYLFRIGCFREAPGCTQRGEEHAEYSWFPGYRWTMAPCAHCKTHLGWSFRSDDAVFFGLILDRLVQERPREGGEA